MNLISKLFRVPAVALALAGLTFVSLQASAAAVALSPSAVLTTDIPGGFDTTAWSKWLDTVVKTGVPSEMPNGIYLTKSRVEPTDTTQSHQSDYFSAVGTFAADGTFTTGHLEVVSETWVIAEDGQRDVDQWLFVVSTEGDLTRTLHMHVVETASNQVLQDDVVPSTADEAMAKWIGQLNSWYAVTTGSGIPVPALTVETPVEYNDAGATGSHAGLMFRLLN